MKTLLLVVEGFSALAVIITVLLHSAKGEGLGGIGGSSHMFHTQKDLEAGLTKVTSYSAAIFLTTTLLLSILY